MCDAFATQTFEDRVFKGNKGSVNTESRAYKKEKVGEYVPSMAVLYGKQHIGEGYHFNTNHVVAEGLRNSKADRIYALTLLSNALLEITYPENEEYEQDLTLFLEKVIELYSDDQTYLVPSVVSLSYFAYTICCDFSGCKPQPKDLDKIYHCIESKRGIKAVIIETKAIILCTFEAAVNNKNNSYNKFVQSVIAYITENIGSKLSSALVAKHFDVSSSHFCRLIKNETGLTFTELVHIMKMRYAEHILQTTNLRVYEVATMVGIENYAYFYQLYKRIIKKNPTSRE